MGNEQVFDTIVSPDANKQVKALTTDLTLLDKQATDTAKSINLLNAATANSKTYQDLKKNTDAATLASEKFAQQQAKTAQAQVNLQRSQNALEQQTARIAQAQDKAAQSAQKALSPYQQLSKRLDELRATAKNVGVTFGEQSDQFKAAAKPVQELDEKLKSIDKTLGQSQRNVGNYGNVFSGVIRQVIPFGESTVKISENLKNLGIDADGAIESVTGLGSGFASVAVGVFVAGIASATYYLTQFKETSEIVEVKLAGLKAAFSDTGKSIVESLFVKPDASKSFGDEFLDVLNSVSSPLSASPARKNDAAERGEKTQRDLIAMEHKNELSEAADAELKIESEKYRALSEDHTKDIEDRKIYLKKAQEIEKEILKSQTDSAAKTIKTALEVGFLTSSLNAKQIEAQKKSLTYAASIGDLAPAQELALNGTKFTAAGYELYKQGLEQRRQALEGANQEELRLQADKNNLELNGQRMLALAQNELDKARIESAQLTSKLILDSTTASNTQKLAANKKYIADSIALIKSEEKNQLDTAGLGAGRTTGKDSAVEAIKRQSIVLEADNKITAIRAQGLKTRQELVKNSNEAISRLNKANIQEQLDNEQLVLTDVSASFDKKIQANTEFVENSKKLIEQARKDAITAANLPGNPAKDDKTQANTRLSINKEFNNQLAKVTADGAKQRLEIFKQNLADLLKLENATAENSITNLQDANDRQIGYLQANRDKEEKIIEDKYSKGKISQKKYNDELLAINDQYDVDRLTQELHLQQGILEIKEAQQTNDVDAAIANGAKSPEIADIIAKSGVRQQKQVVANANIAVNNAVTKQGKDTSQGKKDDADITTKEFTDDINSISQLQSDASKLVQENYQQEIDLLQQKSELIKENAQTEIDSINSSLLSTKDKQDKINVINAQAKQQQDQLNVQIKQEKEKEAKYDRAAAILNILEQVAIGEVRAIATNLIFGIPEAAIIAALGAASIATILATPLPTFALGGTTKGGKVLWGEAGTERATLPDGSVQYSTGPTIQDFPANTKITPHLELMQMIKPEKVNYAGGSEVPWREILSQLKKNEPQKSRTTNKIIINGDFDKYRKSYFR